MQSPCPPSRAHAGSRAPQPPLPRSHQLQVFRTTKYSHWTHAPPSAGPLSLMRKQSADVRYCSHAPARYLRTHPKRHAPLQLPFPALPPRTPRTRTHPSPPSPPLRRHPSPPSKLLPTTLLPASPRLRELVLQVHVARRLVRLDLVDGRELLGVLALALDHDLDLEPEGTTCHRRDGREGMRVGQRHAQRRCACHTCRRARAGANGGAVGVPLGRRVGGARRQPFHPRAKLTMECQKRVKKSVQQPPKRV